MSYKIVADSCCEFPEGYEKDSRYERVALRLDVEDEVFIDDESFDQAKFLKSVAKSAECPKSSDPRRHASLSLHSEKYAVFLSLSGLKWPNRHTASLRLPPAIWSYYRFSYSSQTSSIGSRSCGGFPLRRPILLINQCSVRDGFLLIPCIDIIKNTKNSRCKDNGDQPHSILRAIHKLNLLFQFRGSVRFRKIPHRTPL